MVWWCVCVLSLLVPSPAGAQAVSDSLDLVERARSVRVGERSGVGHYRATVLERLSAYVALPMMDRLAFRREIEADLSWYADGPDTIAVRGARRFLPSPGANVAILEGIEAEAGDVVFNPDRDRRSIGLGSFRLGAHPLLAEVRTWYRLEPRDTLTLRLPTGREVRVAEVTVTPVSPRAQVAGAMWIDLESAQVVREAYVTHETSSEGPPKLPLIGQVVFELNQIAVDYALWDERWWMPSTMSLSGPMKIGRIASGTLEYRRIYRDFEVSPPTLSATPEPDSAALGRRDSVAGWTVRLPSDRTSLLLPPSFAPSIFASNVAALGWSATGDFRPLITYPEARIRRADDGPRLEFPQIDLLRYNRIEGLAIGARGVMARGGTDYELEGWFATGSPSVRGRASASWQRGRQSWGGEVYDRYTSLNRSFDALSPMAGLGVLLFGRDYGEFARQTGAGVHVVLDEVSRWRVEASLRAERHRAVETVASASLPGLWGQSHVGRPALAVDAADQLVIGLAVERRRAPGARLAAATLRAEVDGSVGTFDYARAHGSAIAESWFGSVGITAEIAGGWTAGSVPLQGLYLIGGPGSVSGYEPGQAAGERFGLGRFEVALGGRGRALALFGHAGWASSAPIGRGVESGRISSVGSALVILGGAFRLEVTRALNRHREWRLGLTAGLG